MPIFRAMLHWLHPGTRATLRFRVHPQIAREALPLIEKLLADTPDGETYRCAIAFWRHTERPPLTVYRGDGSTCRIDGPLQAAARTYFPLGGLIETPGVTAHLTPFEANALDMRIREAIEQVIRAWTAEHELYDLLPVDPHLDRRTADREALALIAQWAAQHRREGADHA
ncbi:hypothetical protein [Acidomonas methanolica]|uniref:hypothetical protein n=1 Tax=Acidomonas methanolica TaxID=437 RepID=UPI00211A5840|nr:hypothetical protein [Acidomonas methanolica]MCQ9156785.1 hypothetical protein [Acidomonas methanolica]